jgi:hypothetical protein
MEELNKLQWLESNIKMIEEVKAVQEAELSNNASDYNVGLYNGLELALAILKQSKPNYKLMQEQDDTYFDDIAKPHTVLDDSIKSSEVYHKQDNGQVKEVKYMDDADVKD